MRSIGLCLVSGLALSFAVADADAARLPDTGNDFCFSASSFDPVPPTDPTTISRDAGAWPRQDCRYGADAAAAAGKLAKVGAGYGGFDYTKIANNGATLSVGATIGTNPTDWACTRDNVTGLTWEVKTAIIGDLRSAGATYQWFDGNPATNGGSQGFFGTNTCPALSGACQMQNYKIAVNQAGLCGAIDWRLPSARELLTIVHFRGAGALIDGTYFPYTPGDPFWTGTAVSNDPASAFQVNFLTGAIVTAPKSSNAGLRLVHGLAF